MSPAEVDPAEASATEVGAIGRAAGRVIAPRSRLRVGLGAAVVLVLAGLAVAVAVAALGPTGASRTFGASPGSDPSGPSSGAPSSDPSTVVVPPSGTSIFVHLLGAVARPGLFELREGDRVVDVVAAAGGFTDGADQGQVNLARRLVDGEQIRVPLVGETLPQAGGGAGSGSAGGAGGGGSPVDAVVDLNTADAAQLDTLPGVGPATAQSILDWREENGRFTAVEDLLSVSGIGEKTFEELKDRVRV